MTLFVLLAITSLVGGYSITQHGFQFVYAVAFGIFVALLYVAVSFRALRKSRKALVVYRKTLEGFDPARLTETSRASSSATGLRPVFEQEIWRD